MTPSRDYIFYKATKALLIIGSAIVLICCSDAGRSNVNVVDEPFKERLMTESSDSLQVVMSENGRRSYIFEAPRVEGYTLAKEPYREFRKGVKIITFEDDSLASQSGVMISNYAIYYIDRELWEAVGDVEIKREDGKELYSQQLFWNAQTKRIYSNVDTKILDNTTGDIYLGEGFESDEEMVEWSFRKMKGRMKMNQPLQNKGAEEAVGAEGAEESTTETSPSMNE